MAKKIQLKTSKNSISVNDFINAIEKESLKKDSKALVKIFKEVTGKSPKMWGPSIIGFGEYHYTRANGDYTNFLATGFSPRKSGPTLYIMPGYSNYESTLEKLGPHKKGKSCLYLKKLDDVDPEVLKSLIRQGLEDLKKKHKTDF